jgi:DNA topoisomerase-1
VPKATLEELQKLYDDAPASAETIGLAYVSDVDEGITRHRQGKGFCYKLGGAVVKDKRLKERLVKMAIPPAWQDVWICTDPQGHIQVTGRDDQNRKQYIYHEKWRTMRDLLNFYRTILFGRCLPKIREAVNQQLNRRTFDRGRVIAAMIWILDNGYIRIGNDIYFAERESIGLSTMLDNNVIIDGAVMTFTFKGKSGREQHLSLEHPQVAEIIAECKAVRGPRLFQYRDEHGAIAQLTSDDINTFLQEITSHAISAKDFRTWGGTLTAFDYLIEEHRKDHDKKPEKVVLEAVDKAAEALGNTRATAREHYVHPHILGTYGTKNFERYYERAKKLRARPYLTKRETELLHFLEALFEEEFELLKD